MLKGLLCALLCCSSLAAHWSVQELRDRIDGRANFRDVAVPEVFSVEDTKVDGIPVRIYAPSDEAGLPIILFIHGGAWVAGSIESHDNLTRYLCRHTGARVASIEYTLAPEANGFEQMEECYRVLSWCAENAQQVAVIGDSAGGQMTASLCQMAKDRQGPSITYQVMINPATDLTSGGVFDYQGDTRDFLRWCTGYLVEDRNDLYHPYLSPIMGEDLRGLPPALVLVAEHDFVRDDGEAYAKRLAEAGVKTNLYCQWNIGHLAGHGANATPEAQESIDVAVAALRAAFRSR